MDVWTAYLGTELCSNWVILRVFLTFSGLCRSILYSTKGRNRWSVQEDRNLNRFHSVPEPVILLAVVRAGDNSWSVDTRYISRFTLRELCPWGMQRLMMLIDCDISDYLILLRVSSHLRFAHSYPAFVRGPFLTCYTSKLGVFFAAWSASSPFIIIQAFCGSASYVTWIVTEVL